MSDTQTSYFREINKRRRKPQLLLLSDEPKSYGGELLKTRRGRSRGRPLSTRNTIHLVMRSSKATKEWSLNRPENANSIRRIMAKFASKFGVRINGLAIVGNHLHMQIKLTNLATYKCFIRAISSAIAMAITKNSRWRTWKTQANERFWDYRPFTRIVLGKSGALRIRDYLRINVLEGYGYRRSTAEVIAKTLGPQISIGFS